MKTKEQKRREAYDRLVRTAQMRYRTLVSHEDAFPSKVPTDRGPLVAAAKAASTMVWEWHRRFGYPLPDTNTFHNR